MILDTHDFLLLNHAWIGVAIVTFLSLLISKIRAPYGRHANRHWGPLMANHWGWFWMELPALILVPALAVVGPRPKGRLSWMLVVVWVVHYVHRTLVFPFCLRTKGKLMPLTIVASAVSFNAVNGFFNGYWFAKRGCKAALSSPCEGFKPITSLLYLYNLPLPWNTVRFLASSAISSCQNADFKSIFENTCFPES